MIKNTKSYNLFIYDELRYHRALIKSISPLDTHKLKPADQPIDTDVLEIIRDFGLQFGLQLSVSLTKIIL
jgi:hypothetical protein